MSVVRSETGTGPKRRIALGEFAALINRVKRAFGGAAGQDELLRSQQQAEAQLLEQKLQLDTALNNMAQGLCMFDAAARLLLCNQRYLDMYRLSSDVVKPGCSFRDVIEHRKAMGLLADDPEQYCRNVLEANAAGKTLSLTVDLPDGRFVHIVNHPMPDGGWVVTHEDITERRRAADEARQAHARLRDAIDILPHGLVFLDPDGRYILWNQQYADIYKRSADLFQSGARLEDTLRIGVARGDYPEAAGREEEWIAERLAKLYTPSGRHEQTLADGRCILIEERRTGDGGIIGLRVDITELKQREASFRLLFDSNPVPMFVYGRDNHQILAVNSAAVQHYGYTRAQFLSMNLRHIHDCDTYAELVSLDGASSERYAGRTWKHLKADGTLIDVAIFARALMHENVPAVLIAAVDITERKRAEARVAHMAHHDALTGLPNRVLLRLRMEEMLQRTRRSGKGLATLCVDLDNFKSVNDTLGHPAGDLLLQRVADRIRRVTREDDTAARLGGDEFAILQANVSGPEEVNGLVRRLLAEISEPFDINGHQVLVGASIGIALAPGRRRGRRPAAQECRHGALSRQGRRQGGVPLLRSRNGRAGAGAAAAGTRPAHGAQFERARSPLSAAGRPGDRRCHRPSKRCCAGRIPSAAWSRRRNSFRSRRKPA